MSKEEYYPTQKSIIELDMSMLDKDLYLVWVENAGFINTEPHVEVCLGKVISISREHCSCDYIIKSKKDDSIYTCKATNLYLHTEERPEANADEWSLSDHVEVFESHSEAAEYASWLEVQLMGKSKEEIMQKIKESKAEEAA